MKRLLNKLFTTAKSTRNKNSFRPQIEGLEDRAVPAVYGTLDWVDIPNNQTDDYPNSAAVNIYKQNADGSIGGHLGSGSMIAPNVVLTAAHVVRDNGTWEGPTIIMPGQGSATWRPFGFANSVSYDYITPYDQQDFETFPENNTGGNNTDRRYDVGVIYLDRDMGDFTGTFDIKTLSESYLNTKPEAMILHYPGSGIGTGDDLVRSQGATDGVVEGRIRYRGSLDTAGGSSGSPVLFEDNGVWKIGGVHVSAGNQAVHLDSYDMGYINDWIDERPINTDRPDVIDSDSWFGNTTSSVSDLTTAAGDTVSVTTRLFNSGTATANSIEVGFYASTNNTITTSDVFLGGATVSIGALSSADVTAQLSIPDDIASGNYQIGWIVDPNNNTAEYSDTAGPGFRTGIHSASMNVTALPDLQGAAFNVVNDTLESGEQFDLQYNLFNNGGAAVNAPFSVKFYLSTNDYISSGDTLLGTANFPAGMGSGTISINSITLQMPELANAGEYTIGMIVDADNTVAEVSETNNRNRGDTYDKETIQISLDKSVTTSPGPNGKSNVHANMGDHDNGNDGATDSINAVRNGDRFELWVNGELAFADDADNIHELTITGTSDNDYVTVDADLGFHVHFIGGDGYDRFTINGTSGNDVVDVWALHAEINAQKFAFDDVEYLYINTQFGHSTTTIHQFADVSTFVARGDFMTDTYRINTAADPNGYVYLQGMSGNDSLTAANRSNTWDITSSSYGRLNSRVVFYYMENLTGGTSADEFAFGSSGYVYGNIDGNGGTDRLDFSDYQYGVSAAIQSPTTLTTDGVGGTVSNMEELVGSNTVNDRMTGPNASMYWYITGNDAGYLRNYTGYSPFTFYNVETLNGGAMNDDFRFYSNATMSGDIIGRSGTDTLSYYSYYSGVHVDLMENTATGVKGNVYQIENVNGSRYDDYIRGDDANNNLYGYYGNDILIGMGGDDYLRGSYYGRNILVGGDGADTLTGGRYDDLMIAGFTDYDQMDAKTAYFAYSGMRDLWTQSNYSFDQRIDILRSGFSSNGVNIKLDQNSVHDDGDADRLTGSYGSDWFWASKYDATDFNVYEDVLS